MATSPSRRRFLKSVMAGTGAALLAPARRAVPAAGGKTKMTFAWPFGTTSLAFQEELARRFMERQRSVEIEVQIIPQVQAVPKLTAAFAGGAAPDCLALSHQWLTQLAPPGYFESLEAQLKASGLDRDILPPVMAESRIFNKTAYTAGFLADCYLLYGHRQSLRDAGLSEPPRTIDEFAQAAQKMTDVSRNRYGYYALGATGWSYIQWTTWMFSQGGLGVDRTYFDANGKCVFRGEKQQEGLQRWIDLYLKAKVSPSASATGGWQDSTNAFNAGQIGMVFGWLGLVGMFSKGIGPDKFVVATPPGGPAGQFFSFGANGYAINSQSKAKEAAWEYIRFLLTPEINGLLNKEWGAIPANSRAWNQEWLSNPAFQVPKAMIAKESSLIRYPFFLPEWPNWFLNIATANIQKTMLGQQSVPQFVEAVAPPLEAAIAKAGRRG